MLLNSAGPAILEPGDKRARNKLNYRKTQNGVNHQNVRRALLIGISLYLVLLPMSCQVIMGLGGAGGGYTTGRALITAGNQVELTTPGGIWRSKAQAHYVPLEELPLTLRQGLLFQEDQTFFEHRGYSLREMGSAVLDYVVFRRKLRGASTLTQQLSRTLFLNREKSLRRKLLELRTARVLERNLGKDLILELYINNVYWGRNRRGIHAAAAHYFGKSPGGLLPEESAFLVAILPNPDACKGARECENKGILFRKKRLLKYFTRLKE